MKGPAKKQKKDLLSEKYRLLKNRTYLKPWVEDFKQYRNIEKLERSIVVALIDSIIVYGKDEIAIRFHYQDEMQEMFALSGVSDADTDGKGVAGCGL